MSRQEPRFRRALIVVALIHVFLIGGLIWFFSRPVKKPSGQLTWMETGSFSAPQESASEDVPHPPEENQQTEEIPDQATRPRPLPLSKTTPTPPPIHQEEKKTPEPPSEISLAHHTPTPTPTPTPTATPSPSPTPTPKPSPKATPKATPKPTPKTTPKPTPTPSPQETPSPTPEPEKSPTPKPSPKAKAKPKASPKYTPAKAKQTATPKPKSSPKSTPKASAKTQTKSEKAEHNNEDHPHKSAAAEKSTEGGKKSSSDTKKASTAMGEGTGHSDAQNAFLASKGGGTGAGGAGGNGADASTVDAYQTLIHDRFFSQWEQPTSIPTEHKHDFSTVLRITIQRDGTISDFGLAKPSGNPVMDQSVLEAARKVIKIAPVPEGMGGASGYTININFELE